MSWLVPVGLTLAVGAGLASLWRAPPKPGDLVVVPGSRLRDANGQLLGLATDSANTGVVVRVSTVTNGPQLWSAKRIAGNPAGFVSGGRVQALPALAFPNIELVQFDQSDIAGTADAAGNVRT